MKNFPIVVVLIGSWLSCPVSGNNGLILPFVPGQQIYSNPYRTASQPPQLSGNYPNFQTPRPHHLVQPNYGPGHNKFGGSFAPNNGQGQRGGQPVPNFFGRNNAKKLRGSIFNHNLNVVDGRIVAGTNFNNNNDNERFVGAVFNHNDNGIRSINFSSAGDGSPAIEQGGFNNNVNNNNSNGKVVGSVNNHNANGRLVGVRDSNFNNNNQNEEGMGSFFNYNSNG